MGEKLNNPPLIYALAQLIFNPVKSMSRFVPELQDMLRTDFPDFKEEAVTVQHFPMAVPPGILPQAIPMPQPILQWHFLNFERTSGYMLTESSFNFHTTAYDTDSAFLDNIIQGVKLLHGKVKLDFVERLGMRYINAIYMSDREDAILHPSLRGMVHKGSDEYIQTFSESVLKKENSVQLLIRAIRTHQGFPLSDGLAGLPLPLRLEQPTKGQSIVNLDLDCSRQIREKFDIQLVEDTLRTMHSHIEEAFFMAVTADFFAQEK